MPNFKLTYDFKNQLNQVATNLLHRPVAAVAMDFPLTPEQVSAAMIPPVARRHLDALVMMDANLHATQIFHGVVEQPDVEDFEPVLLQVHLPDEHPYLWETQCYPHLATRTFHKRDKLTANTFQMPFDIDALDEHTRIKFLKWLNETSRQTRLAHAAAALIKHFLFYYCESTAELLARWDGLKILFGQLHEPWPVRIRQVPRRSLERNWGWGTMVEEDKESGDTAMDWFIDNEKRMEAVSGLLAGASIMPVIVPDARQVRASVLTWEGGPS